MATTVYTVETIGLSDDTEVTLRPLNIKRLRVFMDIMERFAKAESEQEGLEVLLDAAAICLCKEKAGFWSEEGPNYTPEGKHTDEAEDVLDMQTIYKVLDVCGGVKLNDPNLLAAAAAATAAAQAGTN